MTKEDFPIFRVPKELAAEQQKPDETTRRNFPKLFGRLVRQLNKSQRDDGYSLAELQGLADVQGS
jgi:hypothetical protein